MGWNISPYTAAVNTQYFYSLFEKSLHTFTLFTYKKLKK